jgi:hypothetical protein
MAGKSAEMDILASNVAITISLYGEVKNCEQVELKKRGMWVENRLYICQHDKFLTRWIFTLFKLPSGWMGANLRFDDKASRSLGE